MRLSKKSPVFIFYRTLPREGRNGSRLGKRLGSAELALFEEVSVRGSNSEQTRILQADLSPSVRGIGGILAAQRLSHRNGE